MSIMWLEDDVKMIKLLHDGHKVIGRLSQDHGKMFTRWA
jgi:hypothetical protein